jgi:RimJ/RimL family protein N-acetyltransferase
MPALAPLFRKVARHGWRNTLEARALKALDERCGVRILHGFCIERPDPAFVKCPAPFKAGFLNAEELRRYARDPETELSERFLNNALARGDECFAIRDADVLVAYGFYSTGICPIDVPHLGVSFSEEYVYMYKAFTRPGYRGRRLHAMVKTQALQRFRALGYQGIVSYVEATNLDSLKSCLRMGCERFGTMYLLRLHADAFAFSSPGCLRFKFRLDRVGRPADALRLGEG